MMNCETTKHKTENSCQCQRPLLVKSIKEFMAVHVPSIILVIPSSLLQTLPGVTFYPTLHPLPEEEPAKQFYWRSYAEQSSSVTASAYPLLLNMPKRYFFLNKRAVLCLRVILSSFKVIQVKLQPLFKNDIFSSCKIWMSDNSHHHPPQ